MRWLRSLSAAALAAPLALLAPSLSQAQTKIDFFFPVPVDGKLAHELQRLTKVFNDGQKDVVVTPVYTGNYDDTKLKAQAAAAAGKPPAVALMSANYLLDLKLAGDIISLEPMLKADGTTREKFLADFGPALHGNATVDGDLYGVPFQNSTPLLYYNKDQFKEVGLDPEKPPQTWDELVADAKKLTKDGRWGFQVAGGYDYIGWIMQTLVMSNGGRFYNEDYGGEIYYDTPSTLGAAQFVEDLIYKHKVMQPGVLDGGAVSANFLAGKVSMMILSTGSLSFVRDSMKMPYGVGFVPKNVRNAVPIGGGSLVMFKGISEDQKQAGWKFIKWLSSAENLGAWSRFTGYFAPRKSSYDLPEMKAFMAKYPDAKVAIEQLPYAKPWIATYQTVAVRKALDDAMQAVMNGKMKAADAVKEAQKNADALLKPYVDRTALKLP
jgi:sn-glycerol 3-phosphate transport system substrate-binding protein